MKKILFCFLSLFFLLLTVNCEKAKEPPVSAPGPFTLTYNAGEGGTIVGISPQTVSQGEDGSLVTAVPEKHYHFMGWSDGVTAASRTDYNIRADLTLTANFAIDQYILTYTAGENGNIDGTSTQRVDHGGTGSTVTAVPVEGYHFVSWSDGVNTDSRSDSDVTADLEVTASFAVNQYTLIYTATKNGTIKGDNPQNVIHGGDGTTVTANPAEHHHFVAWSDGVTTADRTDLNVTDDLAVLAKFAIDQYNLTYSAGENGSIDGAAKQTVDHGSAGSTVTAKPAVGYHFVSWSDGVTTPKRRDTNVLKDLEVTAGFAITQYTLTYSADENGTIDGPDRQTVDHGSDGTIVTAVPNKGYHFFSWSDGVTTPQRLDLKVVGDLTVKAIFEINTYTVGGTLSGLIEETRVVLQNNGGDDLEITANGDFKFTTEIVDRGGYAVSVLTQPTSPNQICTVDNGTGTIPDANITDIIVTCIPVKYTIGGTVYGLPDNDQVILQNNQGDDLVINSNGSFTFATPLDDGSEYEITIYSQPKRPNWTCELQNGTGSLAGMDVTEVIVDCFPEVVLQAKAGIRKVKLDWNSYDFSGVVFNLCVAQDDITDAGFSNCENITGGVLESAVNSPLTMTQLTNDIPYWFQVEARYESGRQTLSEVIKAIPFGGLNDSGIDWCSDDTTNYKSDGTRLEKSQGCEPLSATHPNQDAFLGRDALARARNLSKIGSGSAGFDFTKICSSGDAAGEGKCPPNPQPGMESNSWTCNRDNVTGLVWEIKTKSGLRSMNNTYTWYNPDDKVNGGKSGMENGGKCEGSECDTHDYIQVINDKGLCGFTDWRLPTKRELLSIVDNGGYKPAADERFFPNTLALHYWTSSPFQEDDNSAWQVYFLYGEAIPNLKNTGSYIRLVRGSTVTFGFDNP